MNKSKILIILLTVILIGVGVFFVSTKDKSNVESSDKSNPSQTVTVDSSATGIYLEPSNINAKVNESITIDVIENSNQELVNVVSLKLSFDPTILQYENFENSNAFAISAETKAEGGNLSVVRGTTEKKSGKNVVGKVKFKVLKTGDTLLDTKGSEMISATTNKSIDLKFGTAQLTAE